MPTTDRTRVSANSRRSRTTVNCKLTPTTDHNELQAHADLRPRETASSRLPHRSRLTRTTAIRSRRPPTTGSANSRLLQTVKTATSRPYQWKFRDIHFWWWNDKKFSGAPAFITFVSRWENDKNLSTSLTFYPSPCLYESGNTIESFLSERFIAFFSLW